MKQNFLDLLPPQLKNIVADSYDLILQRALVRAYKNLAEEEKAKMAQIFAEGSDEEKEKFFKNYLQNLPQLLLEEAERFREEMKSKK